MPLQKGQVIGIVILGSVAVGAGVYFVFLRKTNGTTLFTRLTGGAATPTPGGALAVANKKSGGGGYSAPAAPAATDGFPLQIGSSGANVKSLQAALNKMKPPQYTALVVDGVFGQLTYTAVITWVGTGYYPVSQESLDYIIR